MVAKANRNWRRTTVAPTEFSGWAVFRGYADFSPERSRSWEHHLIGNLLFQFGTTRKQEGTLGGVIVVSMATGRGYALVPVRTYQWNPVPTARAAAIIPWSSRVSCVLGQATALRVPGRRAVIGWRFCRADGIEPATRKSTPPYRDTRRCGKRQMQRARDGRRRTRVGRSCQQ